MHDTARSAAASGHSKHGRGGHAALVRRHRHAVGFTTSRISLVSFSSLPLLSLSNLHRRVDLGVVSNGTVPRNRTHTANNNESKGLLRRESFAYRDRREGVLARYRPSPLSKRRNGSSSVGNRRMGAVRMREAAPKKEERSGTVPRSLGEQHNTRTESSTRGGPLKKQEPSNNGGYDEIIVESV